MFSSISKDAYISGFYEILENYFPVLYLHKGTHIRQCFIVSFTPECMYINAQFSKYYFSIKLCEFKIFILTVSKLLYMYVYNFPKNLIT